MVAKIITGLLNKVRLKEFELEAIIECFKGHFGIADHIWLFGSRADKKRRGGDIDFYVETTLSAEEALKAKDAFLDSLCNKIGDQKIDLVLHIMHDAFELPIYKVAKAEGVQIL